MISNVTIPNDTFLRTIVTLESLLSMGSGLGASLGRAGGPCIG